MASFKDSNGREWIIKLDAPTIRMIREETCDRPLDQQCKHRPGVDAACTCINLAGFDSDLYERLDQDILLRVDLLYLLCRSQAAQAGISDVQFGEALVGESLEAATLAMLVGIADFFPPSRRELLLAGLRKSDAMQKLGLARALAKLEDPELEKQIVGEMEKKMDKEIETLLTRLHSATNGQEPSESHPTASRAQNYI